MLLKQCLHCLFILQTIKCLLIYPNPESALNEEAGRLLLEQYDEYSRHARMMTEIHAKRPASGPGSDSGTIETKKRAVEKGDTATSAATSADKKKKDKKKALKRL